ncbi:hypothetical protein ACHAWX_006155 [Stephanocyclus meneghinianus]
MSDFHRLTASDSSSNSDATSTTLASPTGHSPNPAKKAKRGPRGGVYDPFPMKVHRMLDQTKAEGLASVVSWLEHGRAFKIHKPQVFTEVIMPRFFNQSKYTSFQRQLNLYGFNRLSRGRDSGAYHHELFLRGKPALATRLLRQKVKGSGHKTMRLLDDEPDFYTMPPLMADPKDDIIIPNVFAPGSLQYLPMTAVAPFIDPAPETSAQSDLTSPSSLATNSSSSGNPVTTSKQPETTSKQPEKVLKETGHHLTSASSTQGPNPSTYGNITFIDQLNQSIFIHELAMGCSILCQLRRDDNNLYKK